MDFSPSELMTQAQTIIKNFVLSNIAKKCENLQTVTTIVTLKHEPKSEDIQKSISVVADISSSPVEMFENSDVDYAARQQNENNISFIVSRLSPPKKYNIITKIGDSETDVWGMFYKTKETENVFDMMAVRVTRTIDDVGFESRKQKPALKYSFSPQDMGMITFSVKKNVIDNKRLTRINEGIKNSVLTKKTQDLLIKYLTDLYDATKKYILTEKDPNIFYDTLKRLKFNKTERSLRKSLWDSSNTDMEILLCKYRNQIKEIKNDVSNIDSQSLKMVLEVLVSFLQDLHVQ